MPLFVFAASQVIAQKRGANLGHPSEEKERHTEFGLQAWQLRYLQRVLRLPSGFRQRARTPAKRLNLQAWQLSLSS